MTPIEELSLILRPSGGGLYLVSTGRREQEELQKRLYQVESEAEVQAAFEAKLHQLSQAKIVILGVPSDVGAGFLRGANIGPQAIRQRLLLLYPDWSDFLQRNQIIDVGDVFVVPQLLHDEMLSASQLERSRRALYPKHPNESLPVSPLSIEERALDLILSINPKIAPVIIGGDHSTAWPVASALSRVLGNGWGIVQPDAHTDLLPERLGVKYCFATWSHHANELLGRGQKLVQVGIRASRFPKEHWEKLCDVRQFWAQECLAKPKEEVVADIIAHLKSVGVTRVYFSNDIDGTDASFADATGTPEPGGVDPDFILHLIERLGAEIGLCAGDIVEVAPPIQRTPDGAARTTTLAARYLKATLDAILASVPLDPVT